MKTIGSSALTTAALAAAEPKTLLDFAGARWQPARLATAVLVVVDAQREYTDGRLPLAGIDAAVGEIAALLTRARAVGTPVVHVVQRSLPGRPLFEPQGPMVESIAPVAPRPGELVIPKVLPNSFAGTTLAAELKRLGRKDLIVVGFMTHMCVSATVRSALDHGYRCTVVAEACATRDLPDGCGGVVPAAEVHRVELAALGDRFAVVVPTAAEIAE